MRAKAQLRPGRDSSPGCRTTECTECIFLKTSSARAHTTGAMLVGGREGSYAQEICSVDSFLRRPPIAGLGQFFLRESFRLSFVAYSLCSSRRFFNSLGLVQMETSILETVIPHRVTVRIISSLRRRAGSTAMRSAQVNSPPLLRWAPHPHGSRSASFYVESFGSPWSCERSSKKPSNFSRGGTNMRKKLVCLC